MSLSITQSARKNKYEFATVVPMKAATLERRNPRPRLHVCPECGGTKIEQVLADDGNIYEYPCLFCAGRGYFVRNASHAEHQSFLARLAGWGWETVKAVML